MKLTFAIITAVALVGVAVFGVFAMNHGDNHSHDGCLAVTAQGGVCPSSGIFDFLSFHFNAFRSFSTAVFAANGSLLLTALIIVLALTGIGGISSSSAGPHSHTISYQRANSFYNYNFLSTERLVSWLALHEERDPARPFVF